MVDDRSVGSESTDDRSGDNVTMQYVGPREELPKSAKHWVHSPMDMSSENVNVENPYVEMDYAILDLNIMEKMAEAMKHAKGICYSCFDRMYEENKARGGVHNVGTPAKKYRSCIKVDWHVRYQKWLEAQRVQWQRDMVTLDRRELSTQEVAYYMNPEMRL